MREHAAHLIASLGPDAAAEAELEAERTGSPACPVFMKRVARAVRERDRNASPVERKSRRIA